MEPNEFEINKQIFLLPVPCRTIDMELRFVMHFTITIYALFSNINKKCSRFYCN